MVQLVTDEISGMPWRVIGIAILFAFAMWVPLLAVPPMENILVEKLSLNHAQTSLLYGAPILMMAIVAIPAGIVADRIGIKRAAGIGSILIVAGNLLRGIATDYNLLLIFTLIYGIGLGWSFPNLPKLVAHCIPPARTYATMGMLSVGVLVSGGLSLAITLPVIYPVTHTYQGVFLIWSIPIILASILWWLFIKEPPCDEEISIKNDIRIIWQVLRHRNLRLLSFIFLMHNFFFYAWAGWTTLFLTGEGASTQLSAVITSITLWTGIPTVLLVTNFYNRPGRRKTLIWLPSVILAIAAAAALFITLELSWLLMVLVGIATTTRFTTILTLPIEMVPKGQTGTASGLVMSIGYTGALIGPFIIGAILDSTGSFQLVFFILIGISIATVLAALALPEVAKKV